MIVLYKGRRGCGKTTTMVKDAYQFKLRGWNIVTNMGSLSFADKVISNQEITGLLQDEELREYVIVIDEIQTFIDSRRSMRTESVDFTYFIQQIRKRGIVILATTQYVRRVDVAFREHIDIIVAPRFMAEYPVVVAEYFDRTIYEDDMVLDKDVAWTTVLFDPTQVYALFDTSEVVTPLKGYGSVEKPPK